MQYTSTVTTKGQVVIPKTVRDRLGIKPYDRVSFDIQNNKAVMEVADSVEDMMGFIKTKKKLSDAELNKAIDEAFAQGVVENYKKKLKAGRA